jgi:hypothetical protein
MRRLIVESRFWVLTLVLLLVAALFLTKFFRVPGITELDTKHVRKGMNQSDVERICGKPLVELGNPVSVWHPEHAGTALVYEMDSGLFGAQRRVFWVKLDRDDNVIDAEIRDWGIDQRTFWSRVLDRFRKK